VKAIILNGGSSSRFGEDKSRYPIGSKPMIEHIYEKLKSVFDDVVLVGRPYKNFPHIVDVYKAGPVGGVLTALEVLEDDLFVVGCDMPFLMPTVVLRMLNFFKDVDAVVAKLDDGIHPLHAFYSESMKIYFSYSIEYGNASFRDAFEQCNVLYLTKEAFQDIHDWQKSFVNINTKSDLKVYEVK